MGEEAQEQGQSLARIEAGQIPLSALRRLDELRDRGGGSEGSFTSELSVGGFALCHGLGLRPISQVMGSSIYQMGYQGAWGQPGGWGAIGVGGAFMVELDTLSRALNEVRSRALGRLAEEARHVGADAVVGVSTRAGESALETGTVALEHTVLGTAVAHSGGHGGDPVLTELSVAEFAKLVRAGFEPLGIVAWSSVFFAGLAFGSALTGGAGVFALGMGPGATQNYELREFTQAFYEARETVMAALNGQAARLGAAGIVGMRISHRARRQELSAGIGASQRAGLMVTFDAIGTAIGQRQGASPAAPQPVFDLAEPIDKEEP